ncbi:hypothetical protein [Taibaiella koreensis]|uniref:hypothetical protein n=1 Tax=Taibaiella koreensis TaxID=1268548 RepID=UPI000E59F49F|nr:hypothetical protein [Taibaiella koreensis]
MKKVFPNPGRRNRLAYGSIALFHFLMLCLVFPGHMFHPDEYMLTVAGDGLKNNYTLVSYVKEPIGPEGIFKYNSFSYPFGDYVYAADNTPLFAIPFRWFCHHIWDLSDHTVAFFNYFILVNILICGLLAFFIFRRLTGNALLSWLMALILPWTNFQLMRISGHYNLSLTSFCLTAIALFLWWQGAEGRTRKQAFIALLMSFFGFCGFLAHGYYFIIIPVFLAGMLFFSGLLKLRSRSGRIAMLSSVAMLALTAAMAWGTMKLTDGYFNQRQPYAMGYDWMEQKTNFSLLFTHYSFQRLFFPLWINKNADGIELMAYLGNTGLYTLALLFLISVFYRPFRLMIMESQKEFFRQPLTFGIFFSGLLLLSMSFGENYYPLEEGLKLTLPFRIPIEFSVAEGVPVLLLCVVCGYAVVRMLRPGSPLHAPLSETKGQKAGKIATFYLISAVVLYLMFGHYHVPYVRNYANPVTYLHKLTRMVEQFRSITRLAWPFYWTFYIWVIYTLAWVFRKVNRYARLFIVSSVLLLGGAEMIDYGARLHGSANDPSVFSEKEMAGFRSLRIPFDRYQAILPIPYYNAGSEDYSVTLNDIHEVSLFSFQLQYYSGLPLMSCKMSRTPPVFSRDFLMLVSRDSCSPALRARLNAKPVLLAVHRQYLRDSTQTAAVPDSKTEPAKSEAYWQANQIVERNHLQPIDSLNGVYFYSWSPQQSR